MCASFGESIIDGCPREVLPLGPQMAAHVEGDHRRSMPKALLDRFQGLPTLSEEAGVEMPQSVKAVACGDAAWLRPRPPHI